MSTGSRHKTGGPSTVTFASTESVALLSAGVPIVGETKTTTATDVLNILENRCMWCPVWSTKASPSLSSAFAITEVPWFNGLVTTAGGFIVFVKVFSVWLSGGLNVWLQ